MTSGSVDDVCAAPDKPGLCVGADRNKGLSMAHQRNTVNIHQVEAQKKLEISGVEEGIQRFREKQWRVKRRPDGSVTRTEVGIGDGDAGMRIARDIVGTEDQGLLRGILDLQASAKVSAGKRGPQPGWAVGVTALPADKLALITVRIILNCYTLSSVEVDAGVTRVSLAIADAVRDEIDFENWRRASEDAARIIGSKKGVVTRRIFQKWRSGREDIKRTEWSSGTRAHVGAALLHTAITHGGGWFYLYSFAHRGQQKRVIRVAPEAIAALKTINEELSTSQPYRLPMIAPPLPWQLDEETVSGL